MVEPENGVKARVRDVAHMPPVAYKHVDAIVHILNAVIAPTTSIVVPDVGKWPIIRLLGDQLVG